MPIIMVIGKTFLSVGHNNSTRANVASLCRAGGPHELTAGAQPTLPPARRSCHEICNQQDSGFHNALPAGPPVRAIVYLHREFPAAAREAAPVKEAPRPVR